MTTVKAEWQKFSDATGIGKLPMEVQHRIKATFYAGVLICLEMHATLPNKQSLPDAIKEMAGWWEEMGDFGDEVIEDQLKEMGL